MRAAFAGRGCEQSAELILRSGPTLSLTVERLVKLKHSFERIAFTNLYRKPHQPGSRRWSMWLVMAILIIATLLSIWLS